MVNATGNMNFCLHRVFVAFHFHADETVLSGLITQFNLQASQPEVVTATSSENKSLQFHAELIDMHILFKNIYFWQIFLFLFFACWILK